MTNLSLSALWKTFFAKRRARKIFQHILRIKPFMNFSDKWTGHSVFIFEHEDLQVCQWRKGLDAKWEISSFPIFQKAMGDEVWNALFIRKRDGRDDIYDVEAKLMDVWGDRETSIYPDVPMVFLAQTHQGYVPLISMPSHGRNRSF